MVSRKGPHILKAKMHAKVHAHTHLEFHLLSLLGVNGHNVLVVSECVSAVLLLCSHVSLQGLQHPLGLEGKVEEMS